MYLLAGLKQGGWLTKTGQYSTDITAAKRMDRDEALATVARHNEAANILVPVREEDLV